MPPKRSAKDDDDDDEEEEEDCCDVVTELAEIAEDAGTDEALGLERA